MMTQSAHSFSLHRWHADRRRAFVSWALIAGFLLQPVLAYLVTPVFGHDARGQTVVVCTLKGAKLVEIDLPSIIDSSTDPQASEHCSALKLYQMASATQVSAPPVVPAIALYSVALLDQTADQPHRALHFSAYSTRAPPRLS
ncbi:MAG: hypothetical protein H6955_21410 [Chromatiaceae bacterium]|nr:hypothetical protein [Chromatiaceae bacterium]